MGELGVNSWVSLVTDKASSGRRGGFQGLAGESPASGGWVLSLSRVDTVCPRDRGSTLPGRIWAVRNMETPSVATGYGGGCHREVC